MSIPLRWLSRFVVATSLLLPFTATGQVSTARLEGFVTDPSGASIANAQVTAVNLRTKASISVPTNAQGAYVFASLAPSIYRITVESPGFRKASLENLELNASTVVAENFKLEIGQVTETVTVEATAVKVQTSEGSVGRSVTLKDIDTLPQLGRGPLSLVAFLPGASVNPGDTTFTRINGTRQGSNNTRLDGIDANDAVVPRLGLSLTSVNTDSVEEVRLITNGSKAEYGRNAGGQVEMVTRSGSNRFRGNLFDYLRNTVLNANPFFSNSSGLKRPVFIQNIFGGSAGGPIIKDKTFFFYNYQGRRTSQQVERNRTVLTAEARQGIFRWRAPGSSEVSSVNVAQIDPRAKGLDPKVKDLIALSPLPNNTDIGDQLNTAGFRFNNPAGSRENQMTAKFDHILWSTNRIFFRYSRQTNYFIDSLNGADAVFPGRVQGWQGGTRWGYSIGSDWLIKPNLINELRVGYQSATVDFARPDRVQGPQIIPNLYTNPILPNFPQGRNSPVIDVYENMTYIKGKSAWKWGFNIKRVLQYGYNQAGAFPNISLATSGGNVPPSTVGPSGGTISSADRQRFESFYNDLLGVVNNVAVTYYSDLKQWQPAGSSRVRNLVFRDYSGFIQNDYKLTRNLTLNLGLRWEWFGPPSERDGYQGTFDKIGQVSTSANISDFKVQPSNQWYDGDRNNFAPRFGFAWDPWGNGKTAIRGSYGVFFDRIIGATSSLVDGNTPGFTQATNSVVSLDFPSGTRVNENPPIPGQPATVPVQQPTDRRISVVGFKPGLATGYVHQFNFNVQHEILRNTVVDVGWVRTQGVKLFTWLDYNQPRIYGDFLTAFNELRAFRAAGAAPSPTNTLVRIFGTPSAAVSAIGASTIDQGQAGTAAGTVDGTYFSRYAAAGVSQYYIRNFPQFNQFIYGTNDGRLWYDSLQFRLRRVMGSLRTEFNYTFSKSLDNSSVDGNGFTAPLDNWNLALHKGRGDYDRPHSANWSVIYQLPFGTGQKWAADAPGWVKQIIGGWETGILGLWQSGTVFSFSSGRRTGPTTAAALIDYSGDRNIGEVIRQGNGVYFFTPEQITSLTAATNFPAPGTVGTSGRNAFRGPRFFNFDLSLVKKFSMPWEGHALQFRTEAYNLFNNANFGLPAATITTPQTVGRISSTVGNARILQMALRYDF
jgi:hypothetical protein